ncbi:MAG: bifunctional metallophosphatase/5'-nucleotidase [Burkholderiales bacterium]|nr:MAG: bifunctional metallophosphatase/5'-nucleotidase [Burkholderiales bacterium]
MSTLAVSLPTVLTIRPRRSIARACVTGLAAAGLSLICSSPTLAAVLAGWDVHGLTGGANNYGTSPLVASSTDANLTVGGLTRGAGVGTSGTAAARGWGGVTWNSASASTAASAGQYATFSLTANTGYQVSYTSISKLDYRRSGTGATSGVLQYQLGNGAFTDITTISYGSTSSSGASVSAIDLSAITALQNVPPGTTVTFRIVNYGASSTSGTWYVFDTANSTANDLEVTGTVSAATSAVNGVCGTANGQTLGAAPTTGLCATGTPSSVAGTGPWNWSCAGSNGGGTASCSANKSTASPFTIFHMNDMHARVTPHKWIINQHGSSAPVFDDVGGAAYVAGKLLSLTAGKPTALVLDGGDISEGNPVGDMNSGSSGGYGNGGMTAYYELLHSKLKAFAGRGSRGLDAVVVGNHDVRDVSYITNMEHMATAAGIPVISANVRDIATHTPHFPATTTITVNGTKVGIIGYTTPTAQVGASLASTLEVVACDWKGTAACHIADYVNDLRNNQHCDVVILLTHDGHSDLVDPTGPVIADTADAKIPEIAVTGHWHTWAETAWQPAIVNYKTIITESASYMKYIGELNVTASGGYVSSIQHVIRDADITPDPDVQAFVDNLITQYNNLHPGHPVDEVVGYTADNLMLDNAMKWWSADEYPWSGNNTAGQWITDGMKWGCDQIWASSGGCDLAVEAGGGVRADIPAGAVTFKHVYETFPWADDTYYRVRMTGQDILNFLKATNLDAGFSAALDVTAFDGIPTSVKINGAPIGLTTVYKVAINNYMYAHPPAGYTWTDTAPDTSTVLVRDNLMDFMRQAHPDAAHAYTVGGDRYHFNGEYSGGYRAVVTLMDDAESQPKYDKAFIRLLSANAETLARRGSRQVPTALVNADGSVNQANRLAEQELYRSYLGFKTGALKPGDIIEVWGKASFYGGNPEFVDQEGVYGDGIEFNIVGHDDSLAQPASVTSIGAFWNDQYKNHYVSFLAKKVGADTVTDQYGQTIKIWDATAYNTTSITLPGNVGDVLLIKGVPTMENYALRFRLASAAVSASPLPSPVLVSSQVSALPASASAAVALNAAASSNGTFYLSPVADAQVASGKPTTNFGTGTNMYVQSSSTSIYGDERSWVKFDLSSLPAGLTVNSASLQLWDWKSTGAALPVEVRTGTSDSWTETGLTWNTQPAYGAALDMVTLAATATDLYYSWNVGNAVAQEYAGDKTLSLLVKAVTEGSGDATAPSYSFDTREYGANGPVLQIQAQAGVASLRFFYRYSADNASWGPWTQYGSALTAAPYTANFSFPNGAGFYQFYSLATDGLGNTEATPSSAQASVQYVLPAAQTISFGALNAVNAGVAFTAVASASSGLPVTFTSQTTSVCTVSGTLVTTLTAGTCSIAADQAGNANWSAATTVVQSFSVSLVAQTIALPAIGSQTLGVAPFSVAATASSGLTVSLSSLTPAVCAVNGTVVSVLAAGTCQIVGNQGGNSIYAAAPTASSSFVVATAVAGADADAPLPLWALGLLSTGLLGAVGRLRGQRRTH